MENRLNEVENKHAEEHAALASSHRSEIEARVSKQKERMDKLRLEHGAAMADVESKHEAALATAQGKLRDKHAASLAEVEAKLAADTSSLQSAYTEAR